MQPPQDDDAADLLAPVPAVVRVRTLSPILLAYSVPGGAGGSLAGAAAAVLAFPVEGGVGNVDVVETVTDGTSPHD
ncbi:hypothetical protein [Streptomyces rhizosphaerihabitans]|uniref:hypothetical protein n=1 Tax=Streptomyces rhizosphaerihabitans TaxID=1266770 RepID=UPI0021C19637|nr:hypothetical protein [Streptomyces rhizosphaerihabitans]MCT9004640.1 hypothetical protein [Streptomyces rhizosphaerihabitans]